MLGWVVVVVLALAVIFVTWFARSDPHSPGGDPRSGPVRPANDEDVAAMLLPYRAGLEATRRPVVRIALEPMSEDAPAVSKVGGSPYWPEGAEPPTGSDGAPLALLAQVAFEELPRPLPGYPEVGLLQFFIAANDLYGMGADDIGREDALIGGRGFRVVYWPDTEGPKTTLPRPASDLLPHDPDQPRRMRFRLDSERMSVCDHRFDALLGGDRHAVARAYATQHRVEPESLLDAIDAHMSGGEGHKIGGYPYFTQVDPRTTGGFELLLQLDSDDAIMWGDAGVGSFFIDPAALARADVSRVMYTWDCS